MFVHKRLLAYKSKNRVVDVMRMNIYAQDGFCEFEGINIVDGQSEMLANILEGKHYFWILFKDKAMYMKIRKTTMSSSLTLPLFIVTISL